MRVGRLTAPLLGAGVVLAFFAPLLSTSSLLGARDVLLFHLPLRSDLIRLAERGLPLWNPWIHGGQPVLSNPNYAAFYPPTWLAAVVGAAYSLNLLVVLHAVLAFAGAWVLARRLGCQTPAAALAAVGFAGSGTFVSLTASFNLFCGMAWFPWVLAAAHRLLAEERNAPPGRWVPTAFGGGAALAFQVLAGEPVSAMITGIVVVAIALSSPRRPRAAARLLVLAAAAFAFAAVQWLPTWHRLADSPRAETLPLERATTWSTSPGRLAELVFPRVLGDPTRVEEGLYFGWKVHDRGYPYLVSIYPGLLISILALAALAHWRIPRRGAWIFAALIGVLLALGRHNPLFPILHQHLPLVGILRYPEKLLLTTLATFPFAAALGWQRLLDERRSDRHESADLALALAVATLVLTLGAAAVTHAWPRVVETFVRLESVPPPTETTLDRATAFLRAEAAASATLAAAVTALLVLYRLRRTPAGALPALAIAILAGDLWHHGHRFNQPLPAALAHRPPALARELAPRDHRIFTNAQFGPEPELVRRRSDANHQQTVNALDRLDPYSGNLWGLAHAFHPDYDLMLTGQAARAQRILGDALIEGDLEGPETLRFLGAWNVGSLVFQIPATERLAAEATGRHLPVARVLGNPYVLPRLRFVPTVEIHPGAEAALAAALASGFELSRMDHWVDPAAAPGLRGPTRQPRLDSVTEAGARLEVSYRAPEPSFLVAAVTFDPGWRAEVDGEAVPLHPTAVGQIGVEVPGGEHRLRLRYHDRWVGIGALLSAASALLALALTTRWWRLAKRPRPGGHPG